ncbi:MAG TPA: hypothetical protein VK538_04235 [Solirubrobacteraceae bacterium]|nr:hypothetical protein [Solirubrobacteraceae bacterium]
MDREESEGEPLTRLTVGAPPEVDPLVDVVALAVAVDVVGVAVAVDVVGLVEVVTLVEVEVEIDGALVEVALTSPDATFGAETESEAAGAWAVVDAVVSTDATLGAETDTEEVLALVCVATVTEVDLTDVSIGDAAATDTLEMPSAEASTGAANTRASAATQLYAIFLFLRPTTATPKQFVDRTCSRVLPALTSFIRKDGQCSAAELRSLSA